MKTLKTKRLEYQVFKYFYLTRGYRVALEVKLPYRMCPSYSACGKYGGRVDMAGMKADEFICVELKTSFADFKSKSGHNLYGHKNYYAVPTNLVDKIKDLVPPHVGILSCDLEGKECVSNCGNTWRYYQKPEVVKKAHTQTINGFMTKGGSHNVTLKDDILYAMDTAKSSTIMRFLKRELEGEIK